MTKTQKMVLAGVLLVTGGTLIAWNLRDPDAAYMAPEEIEEDLTIDQLPPEVLATMKRETAGGRVTQIQRETEGDVVQYEIEFIRGNQEIELTLTPDGAIDGRDSKNYKPK